MAQYKSLTHDEHLADDYTPCNTLSVFHDLECGHRVKVGYAGEICGVNCRTPMYGMPFICSTCLVRDVRLEMMFETLDVNTTDEDVVMEDAGMSRKDKIQEVANSERQKLLVIGYRECVMAPKFNDTKLQFFDQFVKEDGFTDIGGESRAGTPGAQYRRPLQRVQQGANDEEQAQQVQNKQGQNKPSLESDVEDEATRAVRNALSSCKLTGGLS